MTERQKRSPPEVHIRRAYNLPRSYFVVHLQGLGHATYRYV